jgi:hypothetical protein
MIWTTGGNVTRTVHLSSIIATEKLSNVVTSTLQKKEFRDIFGLSIP